MKIGYRQIDVDNVRSSVKQMMEKIYSQIGPHLSVCIHAGCDIEVKQGKDENELIVQTKNPVAIIEKDGFITVYEREEN